MTRRVLRFFDEALAAYRKGDYKTAFRDFKEIAEEGDPAAQCNLAGMYESGLGTAQDDRQALYWYGRAAEQGHAGAQFALGIKYRHGFGIARNDIQAMAWYRIAVDTMEPGEEREELIRNLEFTKAGLNTHEVAEAERLAQTWWDAHGGHPDSRDEPEED